MPKLPLTSLANLDNPATAVGLINANFAAISAAWDNNLSRDGTTPNSMVSILDANSNRIVNLAAPVNNNDAVRLIDLGNAPVYAANALASQNAAAISAAAAATSATNAATSATNSQTFSLNSQASATASASSAAASAAAVQAAAGTATPLQDGTAAVGTSTLWAHQDHVHPNTVATAAVNTNTTQTASTAFVIGQAATATPIMDGTAAVGVSTTFARADHVHPTDTSRAPTASPSFTGATTIGGTLLLTGVGSPTALTTNTNNWGPVGVGSDTVFRISSTTSINLTGFAAQTAGSEITLINVGSSQITLTNLDANSSAANQFSIGANVPLTPGSAITLWYDGTSSVWRPMSGSGGGSGGVSSVATQVGALTLSHGLTNSGTDLQTDPSALAFGYIGGLVMSTAGASATFSVAAGSATDSTNVDYIKLASFSKTTASFVAGTGNGALDTGTIAASTWYHVFVIKIPGGASDVLVSLSPTSPTMPGSYTLFRRIGSMKTDGSSHWTLFHQIGNEFLWDVPVGDVAVATLGTTATLFTLTVPTGVQVNALFRGFVANAAAGAISLINSPDESVAVVNTPSGNDTVSNPTTAIAGIFTLNIRTNTSAQIRAVSQNVSTTLDIATYGWIDNRGSAQVSSDYNIFDNTLFRGYINGLELSTAGSSTTFNVNVGNAIDSNSQYFIKNLASLAKTTSAWAVGNGNGALDTGAIAASTWYHAYVIKRLDTQVVDVLVSLSATSPTLPSGYTIFRRIGSMKTNGSSQWTGFTQLGNEFLWTTEVQDVGSLSIAVTTAFNVTVSTPPGIQTWAMGTFFANVVVSGGPAFYAITSLDTTDYAPSPSLFDCLATTGLDETYSYTIRTNTSSQFRARCNITTGGTVYFTTKGWIDNRGSVNSVSTQNYFDQSVLRGYLSGLTMSTAGSSTTLTVASGVAIDSTNTTMMKLLANTGKTTAAWAVGSGNGGLDTGSIAANTWYHFFIIQRPDTGVVDVLFSLSGGAPTLPANYTLFRRVGSMKTNGSSQWTLFHQIGNEFLWDSAVQDMANVTLTSTASLQTLSVPTGVQVWAMVDSLLEPAVTTDYLFTSPDQADVLPSASAFSIAVVASTIASWAGSVRTNSSAQIRMRASGSAVGSYFNTKGWIDLRGQF